MHVALFFIFLSSHFWQQRTNQLIVQTIVFVLPDDAVNSERLSLCLIRSVSTNGILTYFHLIFFKGLLRHEFCD